MKSKHLIGTALVTVGLLIGFGAAVPFAFADAADDLTAKMQGKWTVTFVVGGPGGKDTGIVAEVEKNKMTIGPEGHGDAATFKIDASTTPVKIDFTAEHDDKAIPGICELNGDEFKMAFNKDGGARPTSFVPANGMTVVVMKRGAAATTAPAATQP